MRTILRAIRDRRAALHEADRLVAGDPAGSESPGLDHLLAAVRAPGSAAELRGEAGMAAAMAAERRRAASRKRRGPVRTTIVAIVAGLALLIAGGTALATRHGLFASPPSHTSPTSPVSPASPVSSPPVSSPPRPTRVTPSPTPVPTTAGPANNDWCVAWWTAEEGGHPMNGRDRKDLTAAAGGADKIAAYCAAAKPTTSPTGKVKKSHKPKKTKGT
ncbi:hypothetical protein [Actinoplanes subtropicus]|uniref:hypothetical protein n=1 Tax=Actinoplanes subtropicus TaxID=543632 RepID=UPI00068BA3C6|nr:hypothetical protein [Actinoplanes subtropicus]